MDHLFLATSTEAVSDAVEKNGNVIISMKKGAKIFIEKLPEFASTLLLIAVIIFLGMIAIRVGRRVISSIIDRSNANAKGKSNPGQVNTVRSLVTSIFNYIMYFIIFTAVLSLLGINVSSLLAVAGVGGVAISFGAQALVKDVISGLFLWLEGSITVGDWVIINAYEGSVESIAIRTTVLRGFDGDVYTIPNGDIRAITNMTRDYKYAKVNIRCPYEENQEHLVEIITDEMEKAGKEIEGLISAPVVQSIVSFDVDAVIVRIMAQCVINEQWRIERDIRARIKNRFDREGIMMPHFSKLPIE